MGKVYSNSPIIGGGIGLRAANLGFRLSIEYAALSSTADSLPAIIERGRITEYTTSLVGTVHSAYVTMDLLVPDAFGMKRVYVVAGTGTAVRRLHEGRLIDETVVGLGGAEMTRQRRAALDEPVVDALARTGAGIRLFSSRSWSVSGEFLYQASFATINPKPITLDLRVDEALQFGLIFVLDI